MSDAVAVKPKVVIARKASATVKKAPATAEGDNRRRSADGVSAAEAPRKVVYFSEKGRALLPKIDAYLAKKELTFGALTIDAIDFYMKHNR